MNLVIVPDSDNERGVRVVEADSGRVVARGHLVIEVPGIFAGALSKLSGPRSSPVRFVESD